MTSLERNIFKHKLPAVPPWPSEDSEAAETLGQLGFPSARRQRKQRSSHESLTPLSADAFFQDALEVESDGDTFRVYYTPPRPSEGEEGRSTVIVCHHGANYTGLSFACFAAEVRDATKGELGCLAIDARGHGRTRVEDDSPQASTSAAPVLSLANLSADLFRVLKAVFPDRQSAPSLLLVGHSMGGPVVVDAAHRIQAEVAPVVGVAVLDAVEGSALEAIQGMSAFVQAQPKGFDSVVDATEWHLASKTLNNPMSARVSVPALLRLTPDASHAVSWRTKLASTAPYWQGWFTDLSAKFLGVRAAKLLVLAGTDRLDKPMMIGQMQGKYQLVVYPDVGHCLQEDAPARLAETVIEFWRRNDVSDILAHVKKVGQ